MQTCNCTQKSTGSVPRESTERVTVKKLQQKSDNHKKYKNSPVPAEVVGL